MLEWEALLQFYELPECALTNCRAVGVQNVRAFIRGVPYVELVFRLNRPGYGRWLASRGRMVSITPEVEFHIRQNFPWTKLPSSVKAVSRSPISSWTTRETVTLHGDMVKWWSTHPWCAPVRAMHRLRAKLVRTGHSFRIAVHRTVSEYGNGCSLPHPLQCLGNAPCTPQANVASRGPAVNLYLHWG